MVPPKDVPDQSPDVLRVVFGAVPAAAVDVPRVLVGLGAAGEPGAGVVAAPRRRRFEGEVEALVVVPGEGLAHHVGQQRRHHAAHHAVAQGQLGVRVAQRPLEAVGRLRGLHQLHLQGGRGGRGKGCLVTCWNLFGAGGSIIDKGLRV